MEGTFAMCLRDYLQREPNGSPTTLDDMKPFILDKPARDSYVAELESYGYTIKASK